MNTFFLIVLLLVSAVGAQEADGPKPDRWRGMVIDESTPEDAIKAFGKPKEDKVDRIRVFCIDSKAISAKQKEKIFRKLKYAEIEGLDSAELSFLDGKLAMIHLDFKKGPPAASISRAYGIPFEPWFRESAQKLDRGELFRDRDKAFARTFPLLYGIVGKTERNFIGASVGQSALRQVMIGGGVGDGEFPGNLIQLQIISRRLENRDGSNVLK